MLRRNPNRSKGRYRTGPGTGQTGTVATPLSETTRRAPTGTANHPLVDGQDNGHLHQYEQAVKKSFDAIVPTLRKVSAYQHEEDFVVRAQTVATQQLGYKLPDAILQDAWVDQLDMRSLFAWCVF